MSIKEVDTVPLPVTRGEAARPRTRRSVVKPRRWKRYEATLIGTVSVLGVLLTWQATDSAKMLPLFLPGPIAIGRALVTLFTDPRSEIWLDLSTSGQELAVGYGGAVVVGLVVGILMGWYTRFQYALDPFVNFFYSTPRIVLIPVFIIWLGIDWQSKVAVIFLGAVFPIIINTMAGVRNTDVALIRVARSFGASEALIFRRVVLPGAVPFILTGFRLGVGHALTGVIVAEYIAAVNGVGKLIADAGVTFQMAKMFAGVVFIAGTGVLLTWLLQRIENRFQSWRPQIKS
ncbi:MAG TPA: ABC transporter permease [Candidatus Limnocylindria bacterium]|nr:ABC transporter permease [Candidatus Limnocylindria bacterium]